MAVDSSKQKRGKCQVEGQQDDMVDDHPPVPEYVQWNDDRKIDYCSDVSFDGTVDDDNQQDNAIDKRQMRKKKWTKKRSIKTIPISSPT